MKIGIVGCGQVGATCAYACVMQGVGTRIVLVDKNDKMAEAQAGDILHATPFSHPIPVRSGDFEDLSAAGIVMIAAGVGQKPGETRMDLLKRNADVFESIIPEILAHAPDAVLLIATNPVDIMTQMAAKIAMRSKDHDPRRVIGSGTILDTARFRSLLAEHLGVSSHSVHAHVIGEHGDSEVLHWSGVNISNQPLSSFAAQVSAPITQSVRDRIDDAVRNAAYRIIEGKGATYYGIGSGMARIAESIIDDERSVLTCATLIDSVGGIEDVCLSLPQIISASGREATIFPDLNPDEDRALIKSAEIIKEAVSALGY